ncbi:MAG: rod shape-determining protein MreD [Treponema sp.]|nr:rod shape-determining protein MreD [Treponema sp.]
MNKNVIWASVFALVASILQSTVLSSLAIYRAVPDLALCIIVYSAYVNGSMTGQLSGFFSGILSDLLSAAPLGLNSLVRTLTGALTGLLKGAFFLDFLFLPMALCASATVLKAIIMALLHLLFSGAIPAYKFISPTLWIELAMNTVAAPFLFALLKKFGGLLAERSKH